MTAIHELPCNMRRMRITLIVWGLCLTAGAFGCRRDSGSTGQGPADPSGTPGSSGASAVTPQASSDLRLLIRKLGGPDGKQVVNQITVLTPPGDDFTVTEQVGATQLELRGKVVDLKDGTYRVSYDYAETSASGRQQLKSLVEMRPDTEREIGRLAGAEATETFVLSLSRP